MNALDSRALRKLLVGVAVVYCAVCMAVVLLGIALDPDVESIFGAFWEAGRNLDYALHPLVPQPDYGIPELNMNAPSWLPLFQVFALFDPKPGELAWFAVSLALYLACLGSLRAYLGAPQLAWLLTTPLVLQTIAIGQIYIVLFALGTAAWHLLRAERPLQAAIVIGVLVALKPNFAIWGFVAFAAGHYRPAVYAGLTALALSVLPAVLYGPGIYGEWLAAVSLDRHNVFPHEASMMGVFGRLGLPVVGMIAAAAVFAVTVVWAWRTRPALYDLTPPALLAAMLCSPMIWLPYLLAAVPFIVSRTWDRRTALAVLLTYAGSFSAHALDTGPWAVALVSVACLASLVLLWGLADQAVGEAYLWKQRRAPAVLGKLREERLD